MTIVLYVLAGLFCLKILWNLCVPYALALRPIKASTGATRGISLMPAVEVALLRLTAAAAALASGSTPFHSLKNVAVVGTIAVVGSYVHVMLMGMLVGWVAENVRRRREAHPDRDPTS
jgi:hypothetical protein